MKFIILSAVLAFAACTKTTISPAILVSSENIISENAYFYSHIPVNIGLSKGVNTVQLDSFNVSVPAYLVKFQFTTQNSGQLYNKFLFYIDGTSVKATTSIDGNVITIAVKGKYLIEQGTHSYILQAKILSGHKGTHFSISLSSVNMYNAQGITIPITGIPQLGNNFTIN
jgi:hypothetical protein